MTETKVYARQIALFAAFVLPVYKLLETPSLLAQFAKGDLLLPAFLQYVLQFFVLCVVLYAISRSGTPLKQRIESKLGKVWTRVLYAVYAVFFLAVAVLPLLDLEKFVYASFYDTEPTIFSFALFFLFSGFVATKGVRALGRVGDLSLFLFPIAFVALIAMSLGEADFTGLLPIFEQRFGRTMYALKYTSPHFLDVILLLPLLSELSYQKGDGKKIAAGYAVGAVATLIFLAVFYATYSTVAAREHYAFLKIAQYFPALAVIGRIDLLFVYLLCIVLFFYVATPLFFAVNALSECMQTQRKTLLSAIINVLAFVFVLFFNRKYDGIYTFFCGKLFPLFLALGSVLPLLVLLFGKEKKYAKKSR